MFPLKGNYALLFLYGLPQIYVPPACSRSFPVQYTSHCNTLKQLIPVYPRQKALNTPWGCIPACPLPVCPVSSCCCPQNIPHVHPCLHCHPGIPGMLPSVLQARCCQILQYVRQQVSLPSGACQALLLFLPGIYLSQPLIHLESYPACPVPVCVNGNRHWQA